MKMLKILTTLDAGAKGFLHVVEEPFAEAGKLESLLVTFKADEPELKTACLKIVSLATGEEGDFSTDVTGGGLNFSSDMKTFTDAGLLITYVKSTFVPLVEKVYSDFKFDLDPAATVAAAAAAAPGPTLVDNGDGSLTAIGATGAVEVVDTSGTLQPAKNPGAVEIKQGPGLHATIPA
jgi:hypothetical protein